MRKPGALIRRVLIAILLLSVVGCVVSIRLVNSRYREFLGLGEQLVVAAAVVGTVAMGLLRRGMSVAMYYAALVSVLVVLWTPTVCIRTRTVSWYDRSICKENLSQIAKAMYAYRRTNGGYFPFSESGPTDSFKLLYPAYLSTLHPFSCPSVSSYWRRRKEGVLLDKPEGGREVRCHYGYAWRIPNAPPDDFPIMADMLWNHEDGYNVVLVDGSVVWQETPFCSHDPNDNIFAPEPGWDPDTDSYIRQE